eukprot:gene25019-biopygen20940
MVFLSRVRRADGPKPRSLARFARSMDRQVTDGAGGSLHGHAGGRARTYLPPSRAMGNCTMGSFRKLC